MNDLTVQLDQIGDALQHAWQRDHERRSRSWQRPPRRRTVLVLAVFAATIGGGAAVAAGVLKSTSDQERGMLGGHAIFAGSNPECEALSGTSFRCTLDTPPAGMTFFREDPTGTTAYGGTRFSPARDVYLGMTFPTVDATRHVDGGCRSITATGLIWECYLGQSAVENGVIHQLYLGDYLPEPPTG